LMSMMHYGNYFYFDGEIIKKSKYNAV